MHVVATVTVSGNSGKKQSADAQYRCESQEPFRCTLTWNQHVQGVNLQTPSMSLLSALLGDAHCLLKPLNGVFKRLIYFYFVCMDVLSACMSVHHLRQFLAQSFGNPLNFPHGR